MVHGKGGLTAVCFFSFELPIPAFYFECRTCSSHSCAISKYLGLS